MVETALGFPRRESGLIATTEQGKLVHVDIVGMFGSDYRERIVNKARAVGLSNEIQFFDKPMPHEGSQALYLVQQFMGDHLVLVPALGSYMRTSMHYHEAPMVMERYFHIAGESFVSVNGKKLPLNSEQNLIEVPLGIVHQVRTQANPSLTLIIMENARLVAPGRLHVKLP